ncbi:arabinan endo-1,5-alpha-L-arabinosidase [Xanthocytophaga flava]|uniref:arabinan endo-1,5-alpha-L-arabinosidase n=1 Tax=Xanthocytophaga flava TaxID=3048013 RepID=UPI0028D612CC|nr:arabinan endo-1,5-alpha-L-arabinosidase [Xanthocytophaga flavus]MDJ1469397.1 arabinan endo-1,5-alpha-L-arabinosidase [Xanthocytophaga flavus]
MKNILPKQLLLVWLLVYSCLYCCKKEADVTPGGKDTTTTTNPVFNIDQLTDTYASISAYEYRYKWGPYNTHDPSIIKEGDYYYCYSTDAGYGITVPAGIQVRRSKDLVDWQFVGWVFNGLPAKGSAFIMQNGGTPFQSLWAPYIIKVGSEFRLYYSLSSSTPRLSVIGLATATSPTGPWTEKGLVVTSLNTTTIQTNAIDPTVLIDQQGQHWMYYGSAWDGIYILKLNATTGLAANTSSKGTRVAQRGFTGGVVNGNIEGPEIIYNSTFKKYYLFIAYDWLETKYNVRVGRADSPEGPFLDFNGNDMNLEQDNIPMIVAPYKFNGHSGWQGTSHCSVFQTGDQFYMAHQGRPGIDKYFMVLHVRKMFWTEDGWPVVSPERYAATEQKTIATSELAGEWEQITLNYQVVPGYSVEQVSPDFQTSVLVKLNADGTINDASNTKWTYTAPWLSLTQSGATTKVYVERGRDWENKKACLVFTGLDANGKAIWGKK